MTARNPEPHRVWTVAEAKARLSEVLRRAEEEGPQHIGTRKSFVVVPAHVWAEKESRRQPMGEWLVANVPRGANLDIPASRESRRETPFISEAREMG